VSLYLVEGQDEVRRRRALAPAGQVVEAWADHRLAGAFWVGEASKRLLDAAGPPLPAAMTLPDDSVPVFYGPQLTDIESLPREESVRTRALSARGIAVAWITLDRFGERTTYQPSGMDDPVFYLRRVGGGAVHVWRVFRTRAEAVTYLTEAYGADSEAAAWAKRLPCDDFDQLVARYGRRG
jgi:hypothetical protein